MGAPPQRVFVDADQPSRDRAFIQQCHGIVSRDTAAALQHAAIAKDAALAALAVLANQDPELDAGARVAVLAACAQLKHARAQVPAGDRRSRPPPRRKKSSRPPPRALA